MREFALDPAATVGPVALTVQSLERTLYLYRDILGMEALPAEDADLTLAVDGVPLFRLTANRLAHKRSPRTTGLFHAAILTPSRLDLARTLMRLFESDYPLQGAADHLVSEALYLADPDGNGLEIYADRPREQWPYIGQQVQMTTDPLDMEGLLALLKKEEYDTHARLLIRTLGMLGAVANEALPTLRDCAKKEELRPAVVKAIAQITRK